jgi:AcrR family transcriptional regulator
MDAGELMSSIEYTSADERVVGAAAKLFLSEGLDATTMVDIVDEAEVGVATIYRHFQTKTRLAVAAGTLLWTLINRQILAFVESDEFLGLSGIERLSRLFRQYTRAYVDMPEFVAFLGDFDHLVLSESDATSPELVSDMAAYGQVVDSFYPIFDDAYLLGRQDGTIVCELDFRVFYKACAHALMGAAAKFVRGGVIPSDAATDGRAEIESIVDMAMRSLGTPAIEYNSGIRTMPEGA